jgi:predicted  nucleic acid-binding Zn-ribbon protein
MEATEILKMISTYGLALVIAGVFVWDKISIGKKQFEISQENKALLQAITKSIDTVSDAVSALSMVVTGVDSSIRALHHREDEFGEQYARHDERMQNGMAEIDTELAKILENVRGSK